MEYGKKIRGGVMAGGPFSPCQNFIGFVGKYSVSLILSENFQNLLKCSYIQNTDNFAYWIH